MQKYLCIGFPSALPALANHPKVQFLTQSQYKEQDFHPDHSIIIQAESTWNNYPPSDFYGFHLLRELRVRKQFLGPIVLVSFFPNPWNLSKSIQLKTNILRTPGHYFFQFPIDWEAVLMEEYEGIDANTLHDINNHFFNLEGIIDEEFHDLKNQMVRDQENFETPKKLASIVAEQVKQSFKRIEAALDLVDKRPLATIQKELLKELMEGIQKKGNLSGGLSLVSHFTGAVKRLLPPSATQTSDLILARDIPWEVLFVDDDAGITQRVSRLFQAKGITCHIANDAKKAYDILKKDQDNNLITVLICDYRMLESDGSWQKVQGYNILEEVFLHFPNQLALFSLTSFNKRTLLKIQQLHKMQVWSFAKDDVIDQEEAHNHGFNIFVQKVIEEGDKVFRLKRSQPKATSWIKGYDKKFDKPLSYYYRMHRLAKDFPIAESILDTKATEIFKKISQAKHQQTKSKYLEIPSIQENIGKDKKNPQTDSEKLERFRERLLGRRIAIAMHQHLDMNKLQIFHTMKRNSFTLKHPRESDNTVNQYFTTYMALSLEKDIPENLLPEERFWINHLL